jgi:hypothetical protein
MIVLKPLDQAIRDNDPIRAVIAGTGLNQDGKTPGITMPNGKAQGKRSRGVGRIRTSANKRTRGFDAPSVPQQRVRPE